MPVSRSRAPVALPLVACLLFVSGGCALVYQIAWLRTLRMVFGGTTAASAAVLAIFMGGLGFGGIVLGRRADRTLNPLRLYALLELGVALTAALSPLLVALVRHSYIAFGGTSVLGELGGTTVRLALATLVLGLPTFLMGGTLPAAVRAVEDENDRSRSRMGLLYGANTLGAVCGALAATFVSLEMLGTRSTIWAAGGLNLGIALTALTVARGLSQSGLPSGQAAIEPRPGSLLDPEEEPVQSSELAPVSAPFVLAAAGAVGFAFALMELVWYRLLAPLLGGSVYTFGLILAVALLGIGAGGLLYAIGQQRRPTLTALAMICALEAAAMALPYALGDHVAIFAAVLRPLGTVGFVALLTAWSLVAFVMVFPAAVAAGYQFPLLVGLLGAGAQQVGRQVGAAYACNTIGAILGSLAGGFGLLPLLSAPGVWRAVIYLLAAVAAACALQKSARRPAALVPVAVAVLSVYLTTARGPTAFWRHAPIGAGRLRMLPELPTVWQGVLNEGRSRIIWEADGVESAVALDRSTAYDFLVDGKSDGNALEDAPTQIVSPLIAAALHPNPRRALVIGLGTGSTAGWLATIPSMERVDVVELEPAILHVAAACAPVNQNVLANPKVHIILGDAREFLLTTSASYDLVFSEPSNLYRPGVANLFTQEFYAAAAARLGPDGIFAQWVQAYEVTPRSIATVYRTLLTSFPVVETWEVQLGADLLLVAQRQPRAHDHQRLRALLTQEPYRTALAQVWGVGGLEGFYTAYAANADFAGYVARDAAAPLNTDDHTLLEFEVTRNLGKSGGFAIDDLRAFAEERHWNRPTASGDDLDWMLVGELRAQRALAEGKKPPLPEGTEASMRQRLLARQAYADGNLMEAREQWLRQSEPPRGAVDVMLLAEALADGGDPRAPDYIEQLMPIRPIDAEALQALWFYRAAQPAQAVEHLVASFSAYRGSPWANRKVMSRALDLAYLIASEQTQFAGEFFHALDEPFAARALDLPRLYTRVNIGLGPALDAECASALAPLEPNIPWDEAFLERRAECYVRSNNPLAKQSQADLATYLARAPATLGSMLHDPTVAQ